MHMNRCVIRDCCRRPAVQQNSIDSTKSFSRFACRCHVSHRDGGIYPESVCESRQKRRRFRCFDVEVPRYKYRNITQSCCFHEHLFRVDRRTYVSVERENVQYLAISVRHSRVYESSCVVEPIVFYPSHRCTSARQDVHASRRRPRLLPIG